MGLRRVLASLLGREMPKPEIERADRLLNAVDRIEVRVIPKRDLRELRRLDAIARRR